jgi:hypothetical protein
MTAKEKAKELVEKYWDVEPLESCDGMEYKMAIDCALIAVDLRLEGDFIFTSIEYGQDSLQYWQEVKKEIEKM